MKSNMPLNRRAFLKTSALTAGVMGVGFAPASMPVMAAAIKTDFVGLEAGEQNIQMGDYQLPIYVARPQNAKTSLPVMIVVSEIFGVHEHIADVARRFAKLGYLAIAPDFFMRAGDPNNLSLIHI